MVECIDPAYVHWPHAGGLDPLVEEAQRGIAPRAPELVQVAALEGLQSLTVLRSYPAVRQVHPHASRLDHIDGAAQSLL